MRSIYLTWLWCIHWSGLERLCNAFRFESWLFSMLANYENVRFCFYLELKWNDVLISCLRFRSNSRRGVEARGNLLGIICWIRPTGRAAKISNASSKICRSTSDSLSTTRAPCSVTYSYRDASTSHKTIFAFTPTSSVGRLWYSFLWHLYFFRPIMRFWN